MIGTENILPTCDILASTYPILLRNSQARLAGWFIEQKDGTVASVEYLIQQFLSPDKRSLDLSNYNLGDKGAREVTQSPQLKRGKLRSLRLPNNNISDEGVKDIANCEYFKNLTELDLYGNVISDDGVKAIASSPHFTRLKKLGLYGNLIEDEGAIAIAESEVLTKVTHLYISSNRVRREGIEALKKAKCRTRLCHLFVDDMDEFEYEDALDEDDED